MKNGKHINEYSGREFSFHLISHTSFPVAPPPDPRVYLSPRFILSILCKVQLILSTICMSRNI